MNGRRVPDDTEPYKYEPGDYGRWNNTWYGRVPSDAPCPMSGNFSIHEVIEHEDGTITVSPSILIQTTWAGKPFEWHGFLERGIWREA